MTDEGNQGYPQSRNKSSLCAEDYIILTVIVICLVGPILMLGIWQIYSIYFPPALIAIFLGISVASLLYRFLGGVHDATFAIGALKVTGSAAVLVGIAWWTNSQLNQQIEVYNTQKNNFSELSTLRKTLKSKEEKIGNLEKQIVQLNEEKESQLKNNNELTMQIEGLKSGNTISSFIENLGPEEKLSKELRSIQFDKKGPWSPFSKSIPMKVSVVDYLEKGEVASCREYINKKLEIVSEYTNHGQVIRSRLPVTLEVNKYISRADDCSKNLKYQLHISCPDALEIFTKKILECGENNIVKWIVPAQFLPINAISLREEF